MLSYKAGDRAAFEELFSRYKSRIYNYFLRHLGDWATAEDLFQKTFLRLHEARERYHPTAAFSTWIYTIATNLLRDESAKLKVRPPLAAIAEEKPAELSAVTLQAGDRANPEEILSEGELRKRIATAVRALPLEQREAFVLAKYEGRGCREIANIVGSTEGAVKVRIHRAVKALRISLGEFAYEM